MSKLPGSGRRGRAGLLLALVPALVALALPSGASAGGRALPAFHDAAGIQAVSAQQLDDRQFDVVVLSAALGRPVHVRVLLPTDYGDHPESRYPVLYLFHGTSGRASDWVDMGDAAATTAPLELITVMPDAGFDGDGGGWFTNWVDTTTSEGPSQWETFHIGQLIGWVDANLRTIAERRGRAVAGLSQGGFGSMTYAARHPDTFVAAASFSGAPEIDRDPDVIAGSTVVVEGTAFGLDHVQPEAMFGSRITNEINWQGHDPATLIENLRGMALFLWTATGAPGPYDTEPNVAQSGIEYLTHVSTEHFHDHLVEAGIPSTYDDYVYGTHRWEYWARDLREFVGPMMATFADPPSPPAVHYESIDRQWQQWGWSVSITRPSRPAFTILDGAGPGGFRFTGDGIATITTAPYYAPGAAALVTITDRAGIRSHAVFAGSDGRITVQVVVGDLLGPTTARVTVASR